MRIRRFSDPAQGLEKVDRRFHIHGKIFFLNQRKAFFGREVLPFLFELYGTIFKEVFDLACASLTFT